MSMRPRVHFTPPGGWLNDPNGLVFVDGTFHLYYQHHPYDTSWGPMHWGHATSTDLVTWDHRPVALAPDSRGTIYSGSAVVDHRDTAGFGTGALVAAFTYHRDDAEEQTLAWSSDGGDTFTKQPMPVLVAPAGEPDFRDPRILRHGGDDGHWVMLLAVGRAVSVYSSTDLRTWTLTGTVSGVFCEEGTWETPELMRFAVDGDTVWVLTVGIGDGAPAGGSGVQAIAGTFDGSTFTPSGDAWWVDHGPSFYAPQAWSGAPDDRRIWIGWMGNWHTAMVLPAAGWRGQMSVPREVTLLRSGTGYRLVQDPVPELARSRVRSLVVPGREVGASLGVPLAPAAPALDAVVGVRAGATVEVHGNRRGHSVTVRVDRGRGRLAVVLADGDAGEVSYTAQLEPGGDRADVRVLLDVASVEVFAGAATISVLLAGAAEPWTVSVSSAGGAGDVEDLELHELLGDPGY